MAQANVGDGVGNRVMTIGHSLTKYSLNEWRVFFDIRRHHHNFARFKRWVLIKKMKELIVKRLNFPERTIGGVNFKGAIAWIKGPFIGFVRRQ